MIDKKRRLIIVSGLSGAGKTVVLNTLEDLSYYTIDNLPISLLDTLITQFYEEKNRLAKQIAIGIDPRNDPNSISLIPEMIMRLPKQNIATELIFIEADDEVLTRRFNETRRRHPLSSEQVSLSDAIQQERHAIGTLAAVASLRIDTSYLALNELQQIVRERVARREVPNLSLQFMSFGYKNGLPKDSDFVFDLRCLPNPYWEKALQKYCGKDQAIIDFLSPQKAVKQMLSDLENFLERWVPEFRADNRSYLSIAFGCTGGQHRSVFIAEQLAAKFNANGKQVILKHRDL